MSQKPFVNTERAGLKVKSTIKVGRIALNHSACPRAGEPTSIEPRPEVRSGLRVQTALRSGFGLGPKGPGPAGPGG